MYLRCLILFFLPVSLLAQRADSLRFVNRLQFGFAYGLSDQEIEVVPADTAFRAFRASNFAVALRYFDNQLVGFQAEVGLSEGGYAESIVGREDNFERRLRYLDVQLLTQLSPGRGFIQPLLQAGPFLHLPIREERRLPPDYEPTEFQADAIDFRLNYGIRIGVGLNLEVGPVTLQADARFLLGFSDLVETGTAGLTSSRRGARGGQVAVFYAPTRRQVR